MNTTAAQWLERADILREALPYMRRYSGRSIVIKFGGHAMKARRVSMDLRKTFLCLSKLA